MNHREVKSLGFILRVIPAQEADVIVRILTAQGDKVSAFAKAGLKSRKRFAGALQPLMHVDFRATQKNHQELHYLEEAQIKNDFVKLRGDFEQLTAASYLTELIEHCAHEGLECPDLYNLFGAAMRALDMGLKWEGVARQFEVKLLSILGWLPVFSQCSQCGASREEFTLNVDRGEVYCLNCGAGSIRVGEEVQGLLSRQLSTSILKNAITENEAHKIEKITGPLFQSHLGHAKLKSVQFLSSLRRFQK